MTVLILLGVGSVSASAVIRCEEFLVQRSAIFRALTDLSLHQSGERTGDLAILTIA